VIGDGVNVASRLEGLNKQYGTQLLVTKSTLGDLGESFVVREIDNVLAKGKKRPVAIYEVLGEKGYALSAAEADFCQARSLYLKREFAAACEILRRHAANDELCATFVARCVHLLQRPPPPDWDGVWSAKSK
jgi:adenylate cyclase